jgi:hypothetical protein
MYVNAKMIPVETIPEMGVGEYRRAKEGVNSSMTYLIHCKNFVMLQCTPTQHKNKGKKEYMYEVVRFLC